MERPCVRSCACARALIINTATASTTASAVPRLILSRPIHSPHTPAILFLWPRFRRNHAVIAIVGDEISEVLARVLDDSHPIVEILHRTLVATLLESSGTVGERFFHEGDDFCLGLILRWVLIDALRILAERRI